MRTKTPAEILLSAEGVLKFTSQYSGSNEIIKIENHIGFARVPVGIVGPLKIGGLGDENEIVYAPLATYEPTLVASCCRGCKAFNSSDSMQYKVLGEGMSRAPVFRFASTGEAVAFAAYLPNLYKQFCADSESTSNYARLRRLTPHIIGANVHVHFSYICGEATGQNMVTIATQYACERFMESSTAKKLGVLDFTIEGQLASDKKPSWGNVSEPRGVQVIAWGKLSNEACVEVLGCSSERLHRTIQTLQEGGIRNGQYGSNINTANIVAGMFISCGQDAASVAEASWSQLTAEFNNTTKELSLALFIPSLPVGTVGGGTGYLTQKESLQLLDCDRPGGKHRLAGLIAGFALALEVSTSAAIADGTFAESHKRLARGTGKPRL